LGTERQIWYDFTFTWRLKKSSSESKKWWLSEAGVERTGERLVTGYKVSHKEE
jgi:hypothetical protein